MVQNQRLHQILVHSITVAAVATCSFPVQASKREIKDVKVAHAQLVEGLGRKRKPTSHTLPNASANSLASRRRTKTRVPPINSVYPSQWDHSPDEILVLVDQRTRGFVKRLMARRYNLQPLDGFRIEMLRARGWRFRVLGARSVRRVVETMQGDPRIAVVQPNFIYRAPSASGTSSAWQSQYALRKIGLLDAHSITRGTGSKIAIVDTGVDWQHPEFAGALVQTYDATKNIFLARPERHGTAVAGIIAAQSRLLGVAPSATILSARAFSQSFGGKPIATSQTLWKAVNWAYQNGARVLNLSFAGRHPEPGLHRLLSQARAKGVIPVAAAGNWGAEASPAYPAAYPEVIAVTASDHNDAVYDRANRGTYIEFAAPGVSILSPTLKAGYDMLSGTSQAVAHVSGLVALLLSVDPSLTLPRVRNILAASAVDLGEPGRDEVFGFGRINAHRALKIVVKELTRYAGAEARVRSTETISN